MYTQAEMHVAAVKKEIEDGRMTPTDSIRMKTVNLDTFKLKHKGGKTNIAELVELKEHIDSVLGDIAGSVRLFMDFHEDSPIKNWDSLEKAEGVYTIGLDLEQFMRDESEAKEVFPGCMMSDNFPLAEKALKAFEDQGGDTKGFEDISFRDTAMWNITSKSRAKKFIGFLHKKYINPIIKERAKHFKIKEFIFTEEGINFKYKK